MDNSTLEKYFDRAVSFKSEIREKSFYSKKDIFTEVNSFWVHMFDIFKKSLKDSSLAGFMNIIENVPVDFKSLIDYKIKFHFSFNDLHSKAKNNLCPFLLYYDVNVDAVCGLLKKIAGDVDSILASATPHTQPQMPVQQSKDTDYFAGSFQRILADVYSLRCMKEIKEENIDLLIDDINDALNYNGYEALDVLSKGNEEYFTVIRTTVTEPVLKLPAIISSSTMSVIEKGRIMMPKND